ncbi:unnamed protein product, partial [Ixodes hexagonus]
RSSGASNKATPDHVRGRSQGGGITPQQCSLDGSLYKTPQIPPEMFVSPLTTSSLSVAARDPQRSVLKRVRDRGTGDGSPAKQLSWLANGACSEEEHGEAGPSGRSFSVTPGGSLGRRRAVDGEPDQGLSEEPDVSEQHGLSSSTPLRKRSASLVSWSPQASESEGEAPRESGARSRPRSRNLPSGQSSSTTSRRHGSLELGKQGSYWTLGGSAVNPRISSLKRSSPWASWSDSSKKATHPSTSFTNEEESSAESLKEGNTRRGSSPHGVKTPRTGRQRPSFRQNAVEISYDGSLLCSPNDIGIGQGSPERSMRRSHAISQKVAPRQSMSMIQKDEASSSNPKMQVDSPELTFRQSTIKRGKSSQSLSRKHVCADHSSLDRSVSTSRAESSEPTSRQSVSTAKTGKGAQSPSHTDVSIDHSSSKRSPKRLQGGSPDLLHRSGSMAKGDKTSVSPSQEDVGIDQVSPECSSQHASPGVAARQSRSTAKKGKDAPLPSHMNVSINHSPKSSRRSQHASPVVAAHQNRSTAKRGKNAPSPSQINISIDLGSPERSPKRSQGGSTDLSRRSGGMADRCNTSLSPNQQGVSIDHGSPERSLRRLQHASPGVAARQSRSTAKRGKNAPDKASLSPSQDVSTDHGSPERSLTRSQYGSPAVATRQSRSTAKKGKDAPLPSQTNVSIDLGSPKLSPKRLQGGGPDLSSRSGGMAKRGNTSLSPSQENVSIDHGSPEHSLRRLQHASPGVAARQSRSTAKKGKNVPSPSQTNVSVDPSPKRSQGGSPNLLRRSESTAKRGKVSPSPSQDVSIDHGTPERSLRRSQHASPVVATRQSRSTAKKGKNAPSPSQTNVSVDHSPNRPQDHGSPERSLRRSQHASPGVAARQSRSTAKKGKNAPSPSQTNVNVDPNPKRSQGGSPNLVRRSESMAKRGKASLSPSQDVSIDHGSPEHSLRRSQYASPAVAARQSRSTAKKGKDAPLPNQTNVSIDLGSPKRSPKRSQEGGPDLSSRSESMAKRGKDSLSPSQDVSIDNRSPERSLRRLQHASPGVAARQSRSTAKKGKNVPSPSQTNVSVDPSPKRSQGGSPNLLRRSESTAKRGKVSPSPSQDVSIDHGTPERSLRRSQHASPVVATRQSRSTAKKGKNAPSPSQTNVSVDHSPKRSQGGTKRGKVSFSPSRKDISIDQGSPERQARGLEASISAKRGKASSPEQRDVSVTQPSPVHSTTVTPSCHGSTSAKKDESTPSRSPRSVKSEEASADEASHHTGSSPVPSPRVDASANVSPVQNVRGKSRATSLKTEQAPLVQENVSPVVTTRARRGRPLLKRAAAQRGSVSPSSTSSKVAKVMEDETVNRTKVTRATKKAPGKSSNKQTQQAVPSRRGQAKAVLEESEVDEASLQSPSKEPQVTHSSDTTQGQAVPEESGLAEEGSPVRRAKATKKAKKAPKQSPSKKPPARESNDSDRNDAVAEGSGTTDTSGSVPARSRRKAAMAALDALVPAIGGRGKRKAATEEGAATPSRHARNSAAKASKETKETPVKKTRGKRA